MSRKYLNRRQLGKCGGKGRVQKKLTTSTPVSPDLPHLVLLDDPERSAYSLPEGVTRIGRCQSNDFQVDDRSVSRLHCVVTRLGSVTRVHDSESRNGTRVGRSRAKGQVIQDGDRIIVGIRLLQFRSPSDSVPASIPEKVPAVSKKALSVRKTSPRKSRSLDWSFTLLAMGLFLGVSFTALVDLGRVIGEDRLRVDRAQDMLESSRRDWKKQRGGLQSRLVRLEADLQAQLVRLEAEVQQLDLVEGQRKALGDQLASTRQELQKLKETDKTRTQAFDQELGVLQGKLKDLESKLALARTREDQLLAKREESKETPKIPEPARRVPIKRSPLLASLPKLEGGIGELENGTLRPQKFDALVASLARRLVPPVPPVASGDSDETIAIRSRLIVWVVDSGPKTIKAMGELTSAIKQHFETPPGLLDHALVGVGAGVNFSSPGDVNRLTRGMDHLLGDDAPHHLIGVLEPIRRKYSRHDEVAIVVFTLDNYDLEGHVKNIENSVAALRRDRIPLFALTPETGLSDSYWFRLAQDGHGYLKVMGKAGLTPAGSEAPLVELPWGWKDQVIDPHGTVGSAYSVYAWNRLTAASGGEVHLVPMPPTGGSFCSRIQCALCGGGHGSRHHNHKSSHCSHKSCSTKYDTGRLGFLEPWIRSRSRYVRSLNRWDRAVRTAWSGAHRGGLIESSPPQAVGPHQTEAIQLNVGVQKQKKHLENRLHKILRDGGVVTISRSDIKPVRQRLLKRMNCAAKLVKGIPGGKVTSTQVAQRRGKANADAVRIILSASYFTISQQIRVLDEIHRNWPSGGDGKQKISIRVRRIPFCHGTKSVLDYPWPGGNPSRKTLEGICKRVDPLLDLYGQTPWELVIRRTVLLHPEAKFLPKITGNPIPGTSNPGKPGKSTVTDKSKKLKKPPKKSEIKKPKSTSSKKTKSTPSKKPVPRPPARPSRSGGGSSRSGSGGQATGG